MKFSEYKIPSQLDYITLLSAVFLNTLFSVVVVEIFLMFGFIGMNNSSKYINSFVFFVVFLVSFKKFYFLTKNAFYKINTQLSHIDSSKNTN